MYPDHTVAKVVIKLFLICIILGTSITSIIMSVEYVDLGGCTTKYSGISFDYNKWLFIFGIAQLSYYAALLVFLELIPNDSLFIRCLLPAGSLFLLSWYIIGSILFFQEVNNAQCRQYQNFFFNYGLANFIVQTISWSIICCCGSIYVEADSPV